MFEFIDNVITGRNYKQAWTGVACTRTYVCEVKLELFTVQYTWSINTMLKWHWHCGGIGKGVCVHSHPLLLLLLILMLLLYCSVYSRHKQWGCAVTQHSTGCSANMNK